MEIDVIAQWNHDGEIIPRRIQVHTQDGVEAYTIQSYVPIEHKTGMVHGKYVTHDVMVWECTIIIRNVRKVVYLFFNGKGWSI